MSLGQGKQHYDLNAEWSCQMYTEVERVLKRAGILRNKASSSGGVNSQLKLSNICDCQ